MNGIHIHETSRLTQSNSKENIQGSNQQSQLQMPDQESLKSVGHHSPVLTPLEEIQPQLMTGVYGFCLGNAVAALKDHSDGWSIGAGIILSSIAGYYALTVLKSSTKSETRIDRAYIARHVSIFLLCATSGVITNLHNYC